MKRITSTLTAMIFLLILTPSVLGASWSAYVFDVAGLGIDAVNVTAVRVSNGNFVNSTLTNALGFFNVSVFGVPPVRLISSKISYLNDTSQVLPPITNDRVLPFNITLIKDLRGNLTGRVTDDAGNALASATVEALQASITKGSDITDINGNYIISNLTDGTYTIQATATGYLDQNTTNFVVQPNSTTELNFILVLSAVSVSTATSAQASQATPEKEGGNPCPPGTELIERKCIAIKKAEEEAEAEEVPEIEESGEPAEEQLQPPATTGAAVAEPKQVIPLAAGVLLAYILVFVLLLFLMNPWFRVMMYRKLKTYSKNIKKPKKGKRDA